MNPATGQADGKKAAPTVLKGPAAEEVVRLKREVDALETLYHLEPTKAQLTGLLALAEHSAAKPAAVAEASATAEYRETLQKLRTALAQDDEAQVAALFQKLAEIEDRDAVEIESEFDLTDAAIKAAPAALKLITPAQIVSYLAAMENEVPDPFERILFTISEGEELTGEDWKALRDETAEEVGWLVHGFNSTAAKSLAKSVSDLLERGHALKPEQKKELDALELTAQKLTANVNPVIVIQHYMERELAELLSNPRAVAALKARIEQIKK
jgi:hypothetical protein